MGVVGVFPSSFYNQIPHILRIRIINVYIIVETLSVCLVQLTTAYKQSVNTYTRLFLPLGKPMASFH